MNNLEIDQSIEYVKNIVDNIRCISWSVVFNIKNNQRMKKKYAFPTFLSKRNLLSLKIKSLYYFLIVYIDEKFTPNINTK